MSEQREDLTFKRLFAANVTRAQRWHANGINDWSPLEWAGAMCGEAGEAANAAKKLKRVESSLQNIDKRTDVAAIMRDNAHYRQEVGKEVADVIIYALLLCARVGVDPEQVIRDVFNKKSEEYGFPERI